MIQLVVSSIAFIVGIAGILFTAWPAQPCAVERAVQDVGTISALPVRIMVHAPDALIHVDGVDTDRLTPSVIELSAGPHELTFFTADGQRHAYAVNVRSDDKTLFIPAFGLPADEGTHHVPGRAVY